MGNYCGGCCPEFPRLSNSQSPPLPNSQSPAEAVDLKHLYADIKNSTELDSLINHVKHLLSAIEQARSPQDVKKDGNKGSVQGMIDRAAKFLEAISTNGEALKNHEWALNRTGGMQTVISTALKHVGELHWMALGFSAIAYVMDSIQQVSSNFQQCVRLLRKLVDLAERLRVLRQRMAPNEAQHLNEAVHAIVEGVIACCCCMSQRKIFRYLFGSADKANLQDIGTVIDELHRSLILMIDMDIHQQIPRRYYASDSEAPFGAVGIDDKIEAVIGLLDMQGKGSRAVILYGFGGAGKTTLADCVVSKLKRDFDSRGIKYSRILLGEKKLHEDQQDLCAELMKQEFRFKNFKDGQEKLKEVLEKETAFVFIDNALEKDQIKQLLPSQLSLPAGSRLLLTSRNENVIEELRSRNIVCHKYLVDGLPDEAAKKYFRQIVIKSEEIALALDKGHISLVNIDAVAEECHGVPLLLKVYAQYLQSHGNRSKVYDEILDRLRQGEFSCTDEHLGDILLYVYRQLDDECKEAFVDICTYFHGWEEEDVSYIVTTTVLQALIGGALVKIDVSNKVIVHDVLKTLAIKEGKETRVQSLQDLENVEDFHNIKGIWLPNSSGKLDSKILIAGKNHLRVIALGKKIQLIGKYELPFNKLRFLNLQGLPIFDSKLLGTIRYLKIKTKECPESNLKSLRQLQKFEFECLGMKMFSNDFHFPTSLTELDLSNCKRLIMLPAELCSLTGLSKLKLNGCNSLENLPEEFYRLTKLTYLSMEGCGDLQTLPSKFGQLSSLRGLKLSGSYSSSSSRLETLGADFGGLSLLESLNISDLDKLVGLPESFGDLSNLRNLTIKRCRSLRSLPDRFGDLGALRSLDLSYCSGLTCLPGRFDRLSNLQSLDLEGCEGLAILPGGLGQLSNLQTLNLRFCHGLVNLLGGLDRLSNLQTLYLFSCKRLTNLPGELGQLSNLQTLDLAFCEELVNLPGELGQLSNLRSLELMNCSKLTSLPPEIGQLGNLEKLSSYSCSELTGIPREIGQLNNLQSLALTDCSKLTSLPEEIGQLLNLKSLYLSNCSRLSVLPHELGHVSRLQSLSLSNLSALSSLPNSLGHLTSLHSLRLNGCSGLTSFPDVICHLTNLKHLNMKHCGSLTTPPNGLGYLGNLESLDLGDCKGLTSLPESFGHLSRLRYLDLSDCSQLITLPNGLGDLESLKKLYLSGCTSLSVLPEGFGKLSALKKLKMSKCCGLKVLPNDFEDLRSMEYLNLSGCSELEGNTIEKAVKLPKLKILNIRQCPKLAMKWNKMERHKFSFWVQSAEPQEVDYCQGLITAIGAAILQNNCELVDVTGESIGLADFIQPGMTVAFLFSVCERDTESSEEMFKKLKNLAILENWQIIYIELSDYLWEETVDRILESLPGGSRAIVHTENNPFFISDYFHLHYALSLYNLVAITDVQEDDGGGRHFVLTRLGTVPEVLAEEEGRTEEEGSPIVPH